MTENMNLTTDRNGRPSGKASAINTTLMEAIRKGLPFEYRDTLGADKDLYAGFLVALLDSGVLALPDGRWYLSAVRHRTH